MKKEPRIASVMKEVAKIEEKRLIKWGIWLIPSLAVGLFVVFFYGSRVWSAILDLGIFDFASSLTDDFESARAMMVENVTLIWELMPRRSLYVSLFTSMTIFIIIILNKKLLRSFPRRIFSIMKYLRGKEVKIK